MSTKIKSPKKLVKLKINFKINELINVIEINQNFSTYILHVLRQPADVPPFVLIFLSPAVPVTNFIVFIFITTRFAVRRDHIAR